MSDHHLITGSAAGKPVLACGAPWRDGVTTGEAAAASRWFRPVTCPDCALRCPHCAVLSGEAHHRTCTHPSAQGNRRPAAAPHGPEFTWTATGTPAQVLATVEELPEDNPLSAAVQSLLVRALGQHHRDGDAYTVSVAGMATGGRPLSLYLEITPRKD